MDGESFGLRTHAVTMKLIPALTSRLPNGPLDMKNPILKTYQWEVILVHAGALLKLPKCFHSFKIQSLES